LGETQQASASRRGQATEGKHPQQYVAAFIGYSFHNGARMQKAKGGCKLGEKEAGEKADEQAHGSLNDGREESKL